MILQLFILFSLASASQSGLIFSRTGDGACKETLSIIATVNDTCINLDSYGRSVIVNCEMGFGVLYNNFDCTGLMTSLQNPPHLNCTADFYYLCSDYSKLSANILLLVLLLLI